MFKKFLVILLIFIGICSSIFAEPGQILASASAQVTLDTSKISFFRCGFSATDPSNLNPLNNGGDLSKIFALENGQDITINLGVKDNKIGTTTDFYIWIFKLGIVPVEVKLSGTALTAANNQRIAYDVKVGNQTLNVPTDSSNPSMVITSYKPSFLADFWKQVISIEVPTLASDLKIENGDVYTGKITLNIASTI